MTKKAASKKPKSTIEKTTLGKAKSVVSHTAESVAKVAADAAAATRKHVVAPVAEAVGIVEKKRARYVRPKKSAKPAEKPSPIATARSKTPAGKMMSSNVALAPTETSKLASKSKSKTKPT